MKLTGLVSPELALLAVQTSKAPAPTEERFGVAGLSS
jgi:hypothetical protein